MGILKLLFEEYPLYKKVEIDLDKINPIGIFDFTYNSKCSICKSVQTFKIRLRHETVKGFHDKILDLADGRYKSIMSYNKENYLDDFQLYDGICQSCNEYMENFVINIFSTGPEPQDDAESDFRAAISGEDIEKVPIPKYFIRKTGQFPPFEISPDKEIEKFLKGDDIDYYKKALMNLSANYGIGAFAYFRRITENQITEICYRLSKMDFDGAEKVQVAIDKFNNNRHMSSLIDEVYKYMPNSFKSLGENPLQLLYAQLSGGIHSFTEKQCYDKASAIDKILKFIIKNLNEESNNRKDLIKALKVLKD